MRPRTIFQLIIMLLIGSFLNSACASKAMAAGPDNLPDIDVAALQSGAPYGRVVESPTALNWVEMDESATQENPQRLGNAKFWFRNATPEMELDNVFFRIWSGSTEGTYNVTDGTYTMAYYNPADADIVEQGIKDGEHFYFRLNNGIWEVAAGQ